MEPGEGMKLTKRAPYRNKNITQAADGEDCMICGKNDGTTVFCHLNESFAGKGMRQKADDCAGFFGCQKCHRDYDEGVPHPMAIEDWEILRGYYRTIRRLIDKGVLK